MKVTNILLGIIALLLAGNMAALKTAPANAQALNQTPSQCVVMDNPYLATKSMNTAIGAADVINNKLADGYTYAGYIPTDKGGIGLVFIRRGK